MLGAEIGAKILSTPELDFIPVRQGGSPTAQIQNAHKRTSRFKSLAGKATQSIRITLRVAANQF
jgi:hypothetical protein